MLMPGASANSDIICAWHVRRETGIGQRGHVRRLEPAAAPHQQVCATPLDRHARFIQFVNHRAQVVGARALERDFAVGRGGGNRVSRRFNPVGNDFVLPRRATF